MAKKSNKLDVQLKYYTKIVAALSSVFDPESEHFINVLDEDFNLNDFIHVLATRAPQRAFEKLTHEDLDPLAFNHLCNRLIMQDRIDNSK